MGVSLFACVALATGATGAAGAEPPVREGPQPVRPGDHGIGRRFGDLAFTDLAGAAHEHSGPLGLGQLQTRHENHRTGEQLDAISRNRVAFRVAAGRDPSISRMKPRLFGFCPRHFLHAGRAIHGPCRLFFWRRPAATTPGGKIGALRQWASGRCLSSDREGEYSRALNWPRGRTMSTTDSVYRFSL
jgi:hypothetical protein